MEDKMSIDFLKLAEDICVAPYRVERKCSCGEVMNTEHDDRKFEINGKEVCIMCFTKKVKV